MSPWMRRPHGSEAWVERHGGSLRSSLSLCVILAHGRGQSLPKRGRDYEGHSLDGDGVSLRRPVEGQAGTNLVTPSNMFRDRHSGKLVEARK